MHGKQSNDLAGLISTTLSECMTSPDDTTLNLRWREVLERVGRDGGLCRVFVIKLSSDGGQILQSKVYFDWPEPSKASSQTHPTSTIVTEISFDAFWQDHSRLGSDNVLASRGQSLPKMIRRLLGLSRDRIVAAVPIDSPGHRWGIIGFERPGDSEFWNEDDLLSLKLLSALVGASIRESTPEQVLDRTPEIIRSVFEKVEDGVLVVDFNGVVQMINPIAVKTLRLPSTAGVLGHHVKDFLPDGEAFLSDLPHSHLSTVTLSLPDRSRRTFGFSSTLIPEVGHRVIILKDLTSVIAMEERRQRVEQLVELGHLMVDHDHQLKNPFDSVLTNLQCLKDKLANTPTNSSTFATIAQEAQALTETSQRLMDPAPPGSLAPSLQPLGPVILNTAEAQRELASKRGLSIDVIEGPPETVVAIDPREFDQAIGNIIQNAIDVCSAGGTIELSWRLLEPGELARRLPRYQGQAVCLAVQDTGPGIPAELKDHIFKAYVTTKSTGTGLGLSTVREILASHGGVIEEVHSGNPAAVGARFEILLPSGSIEPCYLGSPWCAKNDAMTGRDCAQCIAQTQGKGLLCWSLTDPQSFLRHCSKRHCNSCEVYRCGNLALYHTPLSEPQYRERRQQPRQKRPRVISTRQSLSSLRRTGEGTRN